MDIFITRLKCILRSRSNIFWTFIFPCCLGLFFYFGFGNLGNDAIIDTTNAYIARENSEDPIVDVMKGIEINENKKLFNVITEFSKLELEEKLKDDKISSYIHIEDNKIYFHLNENGLDQTITKSFLDQYLQTSALILEVQTQDPSKLPSVLNDLNNQKDYMEEMITHTNKNANAMIIYFYALIAMSCMFASYWGIGIVNDVQANISTLAARVNVTPTHKFKLIAIYVLAAQLVHFIGNLILIAFLKYVLKVQFANDTSLIILTSFIGTFSGIAIGAFLSVMIKASGAVKEGIATAVSLLLSALSGLMSVDVKYYVDKYIPPLKFINPASLLTDAFNSLYYFNSQSRYFMNLIALLILSLILTFLTYLFLRGKKYDSI
ncbi:MAG TPA: ABC transporter permease [Bacilli bacterium]